MLNSYSYKVSNLLQKVPITEGVLCCNTLYCTSHDKDIEEFCNNIIYICLDAAETYIPPKKRRHKCIPGWSSEVRSSKEKAIMWHKIWKDNGSPHGGTLAEIRRSTRAHYHYVLRKVKRNEQGIRNSKLAYAMLANSDKQFWKAVKSINGNTKQCVSTIENCSDPQSITTLFAEKYELLYSSVNYCHKEMDKFKNMLDYKIENSQCFLNKCAEKHTVNVHDIKSGLKQLKLGKGAYRVVFYLIILYMVVIDCILF